MRIEKVPDPSSYYNYAMDTMDGTDVGPATTSTGGGFVRQSDSHTLWGRSSEEDIRKVDIGGNFINDLYMAATQQVIAQVDPDFEVLVNPFEGGSDHEAFLEKGVPAALTWHFTDYVYHTAKDTLFFSSARELEEEYGKDTAAELADEKAVLTAWEDWYQEALASCGEYFDGAFDGYAALLAEYQGKVEDLASWAMGYADKCFGVAYDVDVSTAAMTLNNDLVVLSESDQVYKATITAETAALNGVDPVAWAATLDWSLSREGSEQDSALYPYCYTGDALERWTTWGTDGTDGSPYFVPTGASASDAGDGKTAVTVTFQTLSPFFTTRSGDNAMQVSGSDPKRNAYGSFIGTYHLTVSGGSAQLATAEMEVNT